MFDKVQLIISEAVESQQFGSNTVNKVVNPALSIEAPLIPTALSFSITALVAGNKDTEKITSVEIEVLDTNRKHIFSTGEIAVTLPVQIDDVNFNVNVRNIVITEAGVHHAVVKFNGKVAGEQAFNIRESNQKI